MEQRRETGEETRARYEQALANLTETLQKDRTILAAILGGSLSYDDVWDKSDIDLFVIGDETHKQRDFCLVEENINVHAYVMPRSAFKKCVEGGLQGAFQHSFLSKSRLLYTHDDSLYRLFESLHTGGTRDRAWQAFSVACQIPPLLAKAEKWFYVRRDYRYAFMWLLYAVENIAKLEILSRGETPTRESIQHALRLNPTFFSAVYTDFIDGPKNEQTVGAVLDTLNQYLQTRVPTLFAPLLDYLAESGTPRGVGEIRQHFQARIKGTPVELACEWLADTGFIEKAELPLRLSDKSRITVKEAAYSLPN